MKHILSVLTVSAALALSAPSAFGGHHTVQDDVLYGLADAEKKLVDLAEAMPEEAFEWRPSEGIRSVSEAFMHVAGANYFFPTMFGASMPEGVNPRSFEKEITAKADVIAKLKESFAFAKEAVEAVSADEAGDAIKMFGQDATKRRAMLILVGHGHEHLGQLIAYARMNEITPPWSAGE